MKCDFTLYKKGVALCLSAIFLISGQTYPAHAQNLPNPLTANISILDSQNLGVVSIPAEWGEVSDFHAGIGQPVILIQDAHAIPDAQKNIHALIRFFEKKYGVQNVAVEGAASPLDAQIFRSFPDQKILKKIFKEYYARAELSGAAAASVFTKSSVRFEGVEDWDLYESAISHYLQAGVDSKELLEQLNAERLTLNAQKKKIYSKDLLAVDQSWESFKDNHSNFLETFKTLKTIQTPLPDSQLAAIAKTADVDLATDDQLNLEMNKAIAMISASLRKNEKLNRVLIMEMNQKQQSYQIGELSQQEFAAWIQKTADMQKLKISFSNQLLDLAQLQFRVETIRGTKLLKEFEDYVKSIKSALVKQQPEDARPQIFALEQDSEEIRLLRGLVNLELSRDDWNELKLQREFQSSKVSAENLPGDNAFKSFSTQIAFYENAEKREEAFMQNLNKILHGEPRTTNHDPRKNRPAIFVAGGFHTEGMTEKLKQAGMSYLVVTPKIKNLPEKNMYREHMAGNVSWKSYFKVENGRIRPYDAFVRATRDQLLRVESTTYNVNRTTNDEVRSTNYALLKSWRDQIIRDLADQGRAQDAWRYTKFLDEILVSHEPRTTSHEGVAERLSRRVDQFISGLRALNTTGKLDQQNIAGLLRSMTVVAKLTGPAAFAPDAEVSVSAPLRFSDSDTSQPRSEASTASSDAPLWREPDKAIKDYAGDSGTPLQEKIGIVQKKYDLGTDDVNQLSYTELQGGTSGRLPLKIVSPKGVYVLKYAASTKKRAQFLLSLIQRAQSQRLPVPDIIQTRSKETFIQIRGGFYYLEDFFEEGIDAPYEEISKSQFYSLGELMAQLHNAFLGFDPEGEKKELTAIDIATAETDFESLKQRLSQKDSNDLTRGERLYMQNADFILGRIEKIKNDLSVERYSKLPKSIVHGDMKVANMKWSKSGSEITALLDWERSREGQARIEEFKNPLATAGKDKPRVFNKENLNALVAGYQSQVREKLTREEFEALPSVLVDGAYLWDLARMFILSLDKIDKSDVAYQLALETLSTFKQALTDSSDLSFSQTDLQHPETSHAGAERTEPMAGQNESQDPGLEPRLRSEMRKLHGSDRALTEEWAPTLVAIQALPSNGAVVQQSMPAVLNAIKRKWPKAKIQITEEVRDGKVLPGELYLSVGRQSDRLPEGENSHRIDVFMHEPGKHLRAGAEVDQAAVLAQFKLPDKPIIVFANLREWELEQTVLTILNIQRQLREKGLSLEEQPTIILAPRDTRHNLTLEHFLYRAGIMSNKRTDGVVNKGSKVLLLDTEGELADLLKASGLSIFGGNLWRNEMPELLTGHNVAESRAMVLIGPLSPSDMDRDKFLSQNSTMAIQAFMDSGALVVVPSDQSAEDFARSIVSLWVDKERLAEGVDASRKARQALQKAAEDFLSKFFDGVGQQRSEMRLIPEDITFTENEMPPEWRQDDSSVLLRSLIAETYNEVAAKQGLMPRDVFHCEGCIDASRLLVDKLLRRGSRAEIVEYKNGDDLHQFVWVDTGNTGFVIDLTWQQFLKESEKGDRDRGMVFMAPAKEEILKKAAKKYFPDHESTDFPGWVKAEKKQLSQSIGRANKLPGAFAGGVFYPHLPDEIVSEQMRASRLEEIAAKIESVILANEKSLRPSNRSRDSALPSIIDLTQVLPSSSKFSKKMEVYVHEAGPQGLSFDWSVGEQYYALEASRFSEYEEIGLLDLLTEFFKLLRGNEFELHLNSESIPQPRPLEAWEDWAKQDHIITYIQNIHPLIIQAIYSLVPRTGASRLAVVDLGAGEGSLLKKLEEHEGHEWMFTFLEQARESIKSAEMKPWAEKTETKFIRGDVAKTIESLEDSEADFVINSGGILNKQVGEPNEQKLNSFMAQIHSILKPDGYVILTGLSPLMTEYFSIDPDKWEVVNTSIPGNFIKGRLPMQLFVLRKKSPETQPSASFGKAESLPENGGQGSLLRSEMRTPDEYRSELLSSYLHQPVKFEAMSDESVLTGLSLLQAEIDNLQAQGQYNDFEYSHFSRLKMNGVSGPSSASAVSKTTFTTIRDGNNKELTLKMDVIRAGPDNDNYFHLFSLPDAAGQYQIVGYGVVTATNQQQRKIKDPSQPYIGFDLFPNYRNLRLGREIFHAFVRSVVAWSDQDQGGLDSANIPIQALKVDYMGQIFGSIAYPEAEREAATLLLSHFYLTEGFSPLGAKEKADKYLERYINNEDTQSLLEEYGWKGDDFAWILPLPKRPEMRAGDKAPAADLDSALRILRAMNLTSGRIMEYEFSRNGKYLFVRGPDSHPKPRLIYLGSPDSQKEPDIIRLPDGLSPKSVSFSDDEKILIAKTAEGVRLFQIDGWHEIKKPDHPRSKAGDAVTFDDAKISPSGDIFVFEAPITYRDKIYFEKFVYQWDGKELKQVFFYSGPLGTSTANRLIKMSNKPEGDTKQHRLVSGYNSTTDEGDFLKEIFFSQDRKLAIVKTHRYSRWGLFNLETKQLIEINVDLDPYYTPERVTFSPDSSQVMLESFSSHFVLVGISSAEFENGQSVAEVIQSGFGSEIYTVNWSPDGQWLAIEHLGMAKLYQVITQKDPNAKPSYAIINWTAKLSESETKGVKEIKINPGTSNFVVKPSGALYKGNHDGPERQGEPFAADETIIKHAQNGTGQFYLVTKPSSKQSVSLYLRKTNGESTQILNSLQIESVKFKGNLLVVTLQSREDKYYYFPESDNLVPVEVFFPKRSKQKPYFNQSARSEGVSLLATNGKLKHGFLILEEEYLQNSHITTIVKDNPEFSWLILNLLGSITAGEQIKTQEQFTTAISKIKSFIARLKPFISRHNRDVLEDIILDNAILETVIAKKGDPYAFLDFTLQLIKLKPRLAVQVLEGFFSLVGLGLVDPGKLDQGEKDRILNFANQTNGFNPDLYRYFQDEGEKSLTELLNFAEGLLEDKLDIKDLKNRITELGRGHESDPDYGLKVLAGAISRFIPASGSSFIKQDEILALLKKHIYEIGDRSNDIPSELRNFQFSLGNEFKRMIWTRDAGEPDERLKIIPDALDYPDHGLPDKQAQEEAEKDKKVFIEKFKAYLDDPDNSGLHQQALEAFYLFARHNKSHSERIAAINGQGLDKTGVHSFFEYFNDHDGLPAILMELLKTHSEDIGPEKLLRAIKNDETEEAKVIRAIQGAQENELSFEKLILSYRQSDVSRLLPELEKSNTGLAEKVQQILDKKISSSPNFKFWEERFLSLPRGLLKDEEKKFKQKPSGEKYDLEVRLVKGIPHGLWGVCAGVCTGKDIDLWKNPNFFLAEIYDKNSKTVMGYISLLTVGEGEEKRLFVPGIEPTTEILSEISAADLYPKIEQALIHLAKKGGYASVDLPIEADNKERFDIASNRMDFQEIMRKRDYPAKEIAPLSWNTLPEPWKITKVLVLWTKEDGYKGNSPDLLDLYSPRSEMREFDAAGLAQFLTDEFARDPELKKTGLKFGVRERHWADLGWYSINIARSDGDKQVPVDALISIGINRSWNGRLSGKILQVGVPVYLHGAFEKEEARDIQQKLMTFIFQYLKDNNVYQVKFDVDAQLDADKLKKAQTDFLFRPSVFGIGALSGAIVQWFTGKKRTQQRVTPETISGARLEFENDYWLDKVNISSRLANLEAYFRNLFDGKTGLRPFYSFTEQEYANFVQPFLDELETLNEVAENPGAVLTAFFDLNISLNQRPIEMLYWLAQQLEATPRYSNPTLETQAVRDRFLEDLFRLFRDLLGWMKPGQQNKKELQNLRQSMELDVQMLGRQTLPSFVYPVEWENLKGIRNQKLNRLISDLQLQASKILDIDILVAGKLDRYLADLSTAVRPFADYVSSLENEDRWLDNDGFDIYAATYAVLQVLIFLHKRSLLTEPSVVATFQDLLRPLNQHLNSVAEMRSLAGDAPDLVLKQFKGNHAAARASLEFIDGLEPLPGQVSSLILSIMIKETELFLDNQNPFSRSEMRVFQNPEEMPDRVKIRGVKEVSLRIERSGNNTFKINSTDTGENLFSLEWGLDSKRVRVFDFGTMAISSEKKRMVVEWLIAEAHASGFKLQIQDVKEIIFAQLWFSKLDDLSVNNHDGVSTDNLYDQSFVGKIIVSRPGSSELSEIGLTKSGKGAFYKVGANVWGLDEGSQVWLQGSQIFNMNENLVADAVGFKQAISIEGTPKSIKMPALVVGSSDLEDFSPGVGKFEDYPRWIEQQKEQFLAEIQLARNLASDDLANKSITYGKAVENVIKRIFEKLKLYYPDTVNQMAVMSEGTMARDELVAGSDFEGRFIFKKESDFWRFRPAIEFLSNATFHILGQSWSQISVESMSAQYPMEAEVLSEVLDARFIVGDQSIFNAMQSAFKARINPPALPGQSAEDYQKQIHKVLMAALKGMLRRWQSERDSQSYFDGLFKREPNIKEGVGGLRDMDFSRWVMQLVYGDIEKAKAAKQLSDEEWQAAQKAHGFLMRARNALHEMQLEEGRATSNKLAFSDQVKLANRLGYLAIGENESSVMEDFFKDYYEATQTLFLFSNEVMRRAMHYLGSITNYNSLSKDVRSVDGHTLRNVELVTRSGESVSLDSGIEPLNDQVALTVQENQGIDDKQILEIFKLAAMKNYRITGELMDEIRKKRPQFQFWLNDGGRDEALKILKDIFSLPGSGYIRFRLHVMGILNDVWPEHSMLESRVIYDFKHSHTLDYYGLSLINRVDQIREDQQSTPEIQKKEQPTVLMDELEAPMKFVLNNELYLVLNVVLQIQAMTEFDAEAITKLLVSFNLNPQQLEKAQWLIKHRNDLIEFIRTGGMDSAERFIQFKTENLEHSYEKWSLLLLATFSRIHFFSPGRRDVYAHILEPVADLSETIFLDPKEIRDAFKNYRKSAAELAKQGMRQFGTDQRAISLVDVAIEPIQGESNQLRIDVALDNRWDRPGTIEKIAAVFLKYNLNIQTMMVGQRFDSSMVDQFIVIDPARRKNHFDLAQKIRADLMALFHPGDAAASTATLDELLKVNVPAELPPMLKKETPHVHFVMVGSSAVGVKVYVPDVRQGILLDIARVFRLHGVDMVAGTMLDTEGDIQAGQMAVDYFQIKKNNQPLSEEDLQLFEMDLRYILIDGVADSDKFQKLPSRKAPVFIEKLKKMKKLVEYLKDFLSEQEGRFDSFLFYPQRRQIRTAGIDERYLNFEQALQDFYFIAGPVLDRLSLYGEFDSIYGDIFELGAGLEPMGHSLATPFSNTSFDLLPPMRRSGGKRGIDALPAVQSFQREVIEFMAVAMNAVTDTDTNNSEVVIEGADILWDKSGDPLSKKLIWAGSLDGDLQINNFLDALGIYLDEKQKAFESLSYEQISQTFQIDVSFVRGLRLALKHFEKKNSPDDKQVLMRKILPYLSAKLPVADVVGALSDAGVFEFILPPLQKLRGAHDGKKSPHQFFVLAHLKKVFYNMERLAYSRAFGESDIGESDARVDGQVAKTGIQVVNAALEAYQAAYQRTLSSPNLAEFRLGVFGHDIGKAQEDVSRAGALTQSHMTLGAVMLPVLFHEAGLDNSDIAAWVARYHQHLNALIRALDEGVESWASLILEILRLHQIDKEHNDMLLLISIADNLGVRNMSLDQTRIRLQALSQFGTSGGLTAVPGSFSYANEKNPISQIVRIHREVNRLLSLGSEEREAEVKSLEKEAREHDESGIPELVKQGVPRSMAQNFPAWYLRQIIFNPFDSEAGSELKRFYKKLMELEDTNEHVLMELGRVTYRDHARFNFRIGYQNDFPGALAVISLVLRANGVETDRAFVRTVEGRIFNDIWGYLPKSVYENEIDRQEEARKAWLEKIRHEIKQGFAALQTEAGLTWFENYYREHGINQFAEDTENSGPYLTKVEVSPVPGRDQTYKILVQSNKDQSYFLHRLALLVMALGGNIDTHSDILTLDYGPIGDDVTVTFDHAVDDQEIERIKQVLLAGLEPNLSVQDLLNLAKNARSEARFPDPIVLNEPGEFLTKSYLLRHKLQSSYIRNNWLRPLLDKAKKDASDPARPVVSVVILGSSTGEEAVRVYYQLRSFIENELKETMRDGGVEGWRIEIVGRELLQSVIDKAQNRLIGLEAWTSSDRKLIDAEPEELSVMMVFLNQHADDLQRSVSWSQGDMTDRGWLNSQNPHFILANASLYQLTPATYLKLMRQLDENKSSAWISFTDSLPRGNLNSRPNYIGVEEGLKARQTIRDKGIKGQLIHQVESIRGDRLDYVFWSPRTPEMSEEANGQEVRADHLETRKQVKTLLNEFLREALDLSGGQVEGFSLRIHSGIRSIGLDVYVELLDELRDEIVQGIVGEQKKQMNQLIDYMAAALHSVGEEEIEVGLDDPNSIVILESVLIELPLPQGIRWKASTTMRKFITKIGILEFVGRLVNYRSREKGRTVLMTLNGQFGETASRSNSQVLDIQDDENAPTVFEGAAQMRADVLMRLMVAILLSGKVKDRKLLESEAGRKTIMESIGAFGRIMEALKIDNGVLKVNERFMMELAQDFATTRKFAEAA